jgi:hypothetical protein
MEPGATVEIPQAREIVPNVNRISAAARAAGGLNVFIRYLIDDTAIVQWSTWFTYFATPERRKAMNETFCRGCHGFGLWSELEVQAKDLIVDKDSLRRIRAWLLRSARHFAGARDRHAYYHRNRDYRVLRIDCARRDADELQGHLRRGRQRDEYRRGA